jgi:hypothetical protein
MSTVIWQRDIGAEGHQRSMRRYWRWCGAPTVALVFVTAVVSGPAGALGMAILFGGLALVVFFAVWGRGRARRINPEVTFDGRHLRWSKHELAIDQVASFSTFQSKATVAMAGGTHGTARMGKARFDLVGGDQVEFFWHDLADADLDALRAALEQVLPGRWRPLEPA